MIKDFELEQRHLNILRKAKNKIKKENDNYLLRLEQMKEKKEEMYNKKRNDLLKEYSKKQKEIEKQLYRTRVSKEGEWKKNSEMMQKRGIIAKEKKRKKIVSDEKDRIKMETQIFKKSKT